MNILIIEDEVLAQRELIEMLHQTGTEINIVACLKSVSDSIDWFTTNENECDLIFMDIELADGQCFQIFSDITPKAPIIFLTAYHEYAIQAFKLNSIDYLLKPVDQKNLKGALQKHEMLIQKKQTISMQELQVLLQSPQKEYKDRFTIKIGDVFRYVHTSEIAYFFSDAKYTYLVTYKKDKFLLDPSLNEIEVKLNPKMFFRVSRKYIINIDAVEKASKFFNSRLKLKLKLPVDDDILISRVKVIQFLDWMGND